MKPIPFLIGGEWVHDTPATITHVNPATGDVNYEVCAGTEAHIDAAVQSSHEASRKPAWRNMLPHNRAQLLHKIADLMIERSDLLARCQMLENGKVWKECKNQVLNGAATFRYAASALEPLGSEITPPHGNYLSMTVYEPWGVIAAITPWNSPITLTANKIAAALAAGNGVVLKPASFTPTCGIELGRIALDAGVPPGVLNVVPGLGSKIGDALVNHPLVRMVSFTGGTEVGRRISELAGKKIIRTVLELGGKSPHIIFADADLKAAADAATVAIFEGTGQSCTAGSRLFVERKVYDQVISMIMERGRALRVDLPDAPGAQLGPSASFTQREFVEGMVNGARKEGAEILMGGAPPSDPRLAKGAFYMPTIVTGITNKSKIAQEEIFGPVLCAMPFDNEEDLLEQANDTVYGLASGIWTADYKRAWRVARALEAGIVWINTYKQFSTSAPFGGFKDSGVGREKGLDGIRTYQQEKSRFWSMSDTFDGGFS
ncbi:MAG: aldehyde dehydrogenase family protein, partial [Candidatus Acidiferrales bacterium]